MTKETKKKFEEAKELFSQKPVRETGETEEQFAVRQKLFKTTQINKFKELLLQDYTKNSTNRSFTQFTKALVKQYLQNPYSYKDQLREVSRYLYRVSTLYKKIILYYASMPTYNYMVTQKIDFTKDFDADKIIKNYQNLLKRLQTFNFEHEFTTAIALELRDGLYCAFVYSLDDNSIFLHILDPQYVKLVGKNEAGQWIVFFDATYFTKGNNVQFVEGINGDTSGCWDQVFIDGYKAYQTDSQNNRWFMLPVERTITSICGMDDEYDIPTPFFSGVFIGLLDLLDYEQVVADKTALENYILLVSKIPINEDSGIVDDFAISLEMVQAMQELIDAAVPALVGTAYSPMDLEVVQFNRSNSTEDVDILSNSIKNLFEQTGAPQLVVGGGASTSTAAIKQSIAYDSSLSFWWLNRLCRSFQYYVDKNITEDYMIRFHQQTLFYQDEYISRLKDGATLGAVTPLDYMTALGNTPYEAWCKLKFESMLGIRELMVPLQSSYNASDVGGRPVESEDNLSDEGAETRDQDKNTATKEKNG